MKLRLYDYWRSSAAYRVRIALNLKGLAYEAVETSLIEAAHKSEAYLALNPQGLVPILEVDGVPLSQSLAIIDWLDSVCPEPRFIPLDPIARAREMAAALVIAADIHPINNLRILKYLKNELGQDQEAIDQWIRNWISEGFAALERLADPDQPFLSGVRPGLADICLVPQMYNARRFETPLDAFPKLVAIDAACCAMPEVIRAHPDQVRP